MMLKLMTLARRLISSAGSPASPAKTSRAVSSWTSRSVEERFDQGRVLREMGQDPELDL